jgi:putative tryptophan/tyrosine transport system substrate-binding protein
VTTRRAFLATLAAGFLGPSRVAEAQRTSGKVPVLGLLDFSSPDPGRLGWWQAFQQGLQELGYVEGQNVRFEVRWAEGREDRLEKVVSELVALRADVIVTGGGEAARAAKRATSTIPIVMATGADPVKVGTVQSLGRPGGNVTGVTSLSSELIAKRVSLLKELLPKASRVAVLWDGTSNARLSVQELEAASKTLRVSVRSVMARNPEDFEPAIAAAVKERALFVVASPVLFPQRGRIAELALRHRLPTMVGGREYAEAGGLLSYAVSYPVLFRRAAIYVDKILKGAQPGDLPIEQPTKFELVINLKTAKALGLTIPPSLLQRADQVIE